MEVHRMIARKVIAPGAGIGGCVRDGVGAYSDLKNPNIDNELFARLRARRIAVEKQHEGK